MAVLLEVNNLTTVFNTGDGLVRAVNDISYTVQEGEILSIVGESGCGKSVSALSLLGLIPQPPGQIVAGEACFAGQDLLQLNQKELQRIRGREIAMIFQDPTASLNPVLTIGAQIGEALHTHQSLSRAEARRRTIELLEQVGIPQAKLRLDDYPHQFSGGMRQRVMIAMAISCSPRLLIADEPTTALDVTIQAQIVELVKQLQRERGMAVIWITHDLGVVAGLADRVLVMYSGRIVETAAVEELYEHPRHPYTIGLLASLPRLDAEISGELPAIEGVPPDLANLGPGCSFAPRCRYQIERCLADDPPLIAAAPEHFAACWVDTHQESEP